MSQERLIYSYREYSDFIDSLENNELKGEIEVSENVITVGETTYKIGDRFKSLADYVVNWVTDSFREKLPKTLENVSIENEEDLNNLLDYFELDEEGQLDELVDIKHPIIETDVYKIEVKWMPEVVYEELGKLFDFKVESVYKETSQRDSFVYYQESPKKILKVEGYNFDVY